MTYIPSTFNVNYSLPGIFPVVDDTTGPDLLSNPGKRVLELDYLDQRLQNILNGIRSWVTVVWNGQKWTTLCFQFQGTTGAWFISLAFNGLSHPMQLQPGMNVRIPSIIDINYLIAKANAKSSNGTIISIGPPNIIGS
jgi:hypothetical protein